MSLSGSDRSTGTAFRVAAHRDGEMVAEWTFPDLAAAEAFMEEWSEQHPGDLLTIEDDSIDHSAFELVEDDTRPGEDYGR